MYTACRKKACLQMTDAKQWRNQVSSLSIGGASYLLRGFGVTLKTLLDLFVPNQKPIVPCYYIEFDFGRSFGLKSPFLVIPVLEYFTHMHAQTQTITLDST